MDDLISRQAAIDALKGLPSAQPERIFCPNCGAKMDGERSE